MVGFLMGGMVSASLTIYSYTSVAFFTAIASPVFPASNSFQVRFNFFSGQYTVPFPCVSPVFWTHRQLRSVI